jgi:hypothetical protein
LNQTTLLYGALIFIYFILLFFSFYKFWCFYFVIYFFSWQAKQDGQQSRVEIWSKDAQGVSDTYLEELAKHWTKNAKVKHEAKLCVCSSWFLLHLSSLGTKEHCDEAGVMYVAPCFFIFSLRKVSGQQILERCIRIWKGFFFLRFAIHIHTLRKKIQVQRCKLVWIPKCLPTNYFIIYFQEKFFYLKIFIIIIIVHQIYLFIITHARPAST